MTKGEASPDSADTILQNVLSGKVDQHAWIKGLSPLIYCATIFEEDTGRQLIEKKLVDVDEVTRDGYTALHMASE